MQISKTLRLRDAIACSLCLLAFSNIQAVEPTTLQGKVIAVGSEYGNLDTDIAIKLITLDFGESFSISCRTRSEKAVFAADYADVHSGEWLGLENGEGKLQLAISYGDAADVLNCSVDDAITITF